MSFKFDLISDLHEEFWSENEQINWEGIGTSLIAVILGDISYDLDKTYKTIIDISKHYKYVIFVDGNHEHGYQANFQEHNSILKSKLSKYSNIAFLNRSAIVVDGIAFVGANGWWTFDFAEPEVSREDAYWYLLNNNYYSEPYLQEVLASAREDAAVMSEIVTKLTGDRAVKEIVILTHTSPNPQFIAKTQEQHIAQYGRCGSSYLNNVLSYDTNAKIKTWCFGHIHQEVDQVVDNIRYICHPRGRKDDCPQNLFYYPKMVKLS